MLTHVYSNLNLRIALILLDIGVYLIACDVIIIIIFFISFVKSLKRVAPSVSHVAYN